MGDHAGNRNRMTDVLAELDAVALDFPSAVFRRSKFVLISVVALLQAASERPCFYGLFLLCPAPQLIRRYRQTESNAASAIATFTFILTSETSTCKA
jgi:hypothetical protein